jgi:uroporphyrin-III C-methyltransferase
MKSGFVYIVGAGPGDPDLITVKGRRCVRHADVILHDRLIHPGVLAEARPKAIVIDAGKRFGHEDQQQAEIHSLMIKYAREGNEVCRLKGGDPFIFGRGGEEVAILKAAQVPFEVIPGVSSFTAAPAAAGIPLTPSRLHARISCHHRNRNRQASTHPNGAPPRSPEGAWDRRGADGSGAACRHH